MKTDLSCATALLFILLLAQSLIGKAKTIFVTDYGARPNSRSNAAAAVKAALTACKEQDADILSFPKGRYDFYSDGSTLVGIELDSLKNLIVEGNDSEFVFHGRCKIAGIKDCSQIEMRNFSADWDRPYTIQATILDATDNYLDAKIDASQYPFCIDNGKFYVLGENWKLAPTSQYNNLYDAKTGEIVYNTQDAPLADIFSKDATDMGNGVIRFRGNVPIKPASGTIVAIYTGRYTGMEGIYINESKDICLRNIRINYAMNIGIRAQHSENVTLDNACAMANKSKKRVFSTIADNAHFNCCRGTIKVLNCKATGMGDDFLNVHGRNYPILQVLDSVTADIRIQDATLKEDEYVWLLDKRNKQRVATVRIKQITGWSNNNGKYLSYRVKFCSPLPKGIGKGNMIESATWVPDVTVSGCFLGRTNRARGILVTTPGKVLIENNRFSTAGAAILIEGDDSRWFESGACRSVTIRNNVFDGCLTSGNRHRNRSGWGNAVITITPYHFPKMYDTPFHSNITITQNVFKTNDAPLLYARSVDGLTFAENTILSDKSYPPHPVKREAIDLDSCRNANICNNKWNGTRLSNKVSVRNMRSSELKLNDHTIKKVTPSNNE